MKFNIKNLLNSLFLKFGYDLRRIDVREFRMEFRRSGGGGRYRVSKCDNSIRKDSKFVL